MSVIDKMRSFSEARTEDRELLPPACLSYGDIREILGELARLRHALDGAERVLQIAASYNPQEWPNVGLRIHCADAKVWAERARLALDSSVEI